METAQTQGRVADVVANWDTPVSILRQSNRYSDKHHTTTQVEILPVDKGDAALPFCQIWFSWERVVLRWLALTFGLRGSGRLYSFPYIFHPFFITPSLCIVAHKLTGLPWGNTVIQLHKKFKIPSLRQHVFSKRAPPPVSWFSSLLQLSHSAATLMRTSSV